MTRRGLVLCALGTGVVLAVAAGLAARVPEDIGGMTRDRAELYIAAAAAAGALYAAAAWQVLRGPAGHGGLAAVLGLALAMRALTLLSPPLQSTDIYRYVWDGRVQAAGINPYAHLPAAPELRALRDEGTGAEAIYPNINRADFAPTIYPPAAQAIFAAVGLVWPTIWGMKAAMLLFDLLGIGGALLLLRAAALPLERVLILAWNPLVVWEFAGAGHIDAAALGLSGLALVAAARRYPAAAGLALAGAVLCKLLPAALAPALWRRWDWRLPAAVGAAMVLSYGAYALGGWGAGWRVLGYLPGYASEEGLGEGDGFFLLRALALLGPVPHWAGMAYAALAGAGLLALAAWVALRAPLPDAMPARTRVICRDAVLLTGATMAVLSPHYPWYFTALALPCVVWPNPAALWLTLAAPVLYLDHGLGMVAAPALVFLPAAALLAVPLFQRRPHPALPA